MLYYGCSTLSSDDMKTLIISIAFLFAASLVMASPQAPDAPGEDPFMGMAEEAYIDDIPFDTWRIGMANDPEVQIMSLPEEEYVDDIPFDTKKIACKTLFDCMMKSYEEANVDDIPFNTEKIAQKALFRKCVSAFMEVDNVDDIPCEVAATYTYDKKRDCLIIQAGAEREVRGVRSLNDIDFRMNLERYMRQFNERIRELDHLSIDEPF